MKQFVRQGSFILFVIFVTTAFFGLIKDFFMACFWATVLAVIFQDTYRRIRIRTRGRDNLSAAITTLFILLAVVIPVLLITGALVNEVAKAYEQMSSGSFNLEETMVELRGRIRVIDRVFSGLGISLDQMREWAGQATVSLSGFLADQAVAYTQNAINATVQFAIMIYLLYFFLRDGRKIVRIIIDAVPLGNRMERLLLGRFASVSRATLKGTLIVATIQGTLGGLLFWAVGIPGAIFWGVVMTLFSILPIGSGFIWGPAAIIFLFQGEIARALIVAAVGALLIGLVDNLLRPILVGRDTQMPDYVVLLSTLGGLTWFGLTGFVIGPVIAALFISCWDIMGKEYGGRDN